MNNNNNHDDPFTDGAIQEEMQRILHGDLRKETKSSSHSIPSLAAENNGSSIGKETQQHNYLYKKPTIRMEDMSCLELEMAFSTADGLGPETHEDEADEERRMLMTAEQEETKDSDGVTMEELKGLNRKLMSKLVNMRRVFKHELATAFTSFQKENGLLRETIERLQLELEAMKGVRGEDEKKSLYYNNDIEEKNVTLSDEETEEDSCPLIRLVDDLIEKSKTEISIWNEHAIQATTHESADASFTEQHKLRLALFEHEN